jgi:phosphoenolpyruvate carboxylase
MAPTVQNVGQQCYAEFEPMFQSINHLLHPMPQSEEQVQAHLRSNIRMLGDFLGQTIIDQESQHVFDTEEEIRRLAKSARGGDADADQQLVSLIANLADDLPLANANLKAFSTYFQLVNLAEELERVRVLRERAQDAYDQGQPMDETVGGALETLKREGVTADDVRATLEQLAITPVFTAHPTESKRRTIRQILRRISELLQETSSNDLFEKERVEVRRRLHDHIVLLWQSDETRERRPTVMDEVRNTGLYFFERTLLKLIPRMYEELESALAESFPGETFDVPSFLKYGSWIGGDRDGNPFVTIDVTRQTLVAHKDLVLEFYAREIQGLYELLSVSRLRNGFSEAFLTSLQVDMARAEAGEDDLVHRFQQEPYRQKLVLMYRRLLVTRRLNQTAWNDTPWEPMAYRECQEFLEDLYLIRDSLIANHGQQLVSGQFSRLVRAAEVFGFHLATLDVRQHARHHRSAAAEVFEFNGTTPDYGALDEPQRATLLTEEIQSPRPWTGGRHVGGGFGFSDSTNELLTLFRLINQAQHLFGPEAMKTYIISMTQGVSDLLEVLLLAEDAGLAGRIDIVPLFETVDDLKAAPRVMAELFENSVYAEHLKQRGNAQQIMIGYSDSNKDGGYLQANWMLFQAQRRLAKTCDQHGVAMTLFHGRGGSLGRGGGPTNRAILAQPPESVRGRIRITEQGEVVSSRYSNPEIAHRHLQQLMHAVLCSTGTRPVYEQINNWSATMDELSESAYRKYRSLVERDQFIDYFQNASPIDQIGSLNIGSRPSHRRATKTLDDLRAIPWVFAWTQSRTNVPSWYGVGTAFATWLNDQDSAQRLQVLQDMYQQWPFFRTLLSNVHLGMGRADMSIARHYAELAGAAGQEVFADIEAEFELSRKHVLQITGGDQLLHTEPWLQHSIRVRNPYVDPLNYIQVELLRQFRANPDQPNAAELQAAILQSINGIAAGLQNVG